MTREQVREKTMSTNYNYTECGLDNVVIHGMQVPVDDAGEKVYAIRNILGLHRVIAHCIITSDHGLLPKELRYLRTEIGLTQSELAQMVQKDHQTVGRWERGEVPIDGNAELVIRMLAAEKLGIDPEMSIEEMAKNCLPSAEFRIIAIDGSDPKHYRPLAA